MAPVNNDIYYESPIISTSTQKKNQDMSALGMEDFMQLMVAQMQHQDIYNPVSDTEFIAQMAQFSALEGINAIQQYQISSYAIGYVGKEVIIANMSDDGTLERIRGVVEKVGFSSGEPLVTVGGKEYPLYTVMEVVAPGYVDPSEEPDDTKEPEMPPDPPTSAGTDQDQDGTGTEAASAAAYPFYVDPYKYGVPGDND